MRLRDGLALSFASAVCFFVGSFSAAGQSSQAVKPDSSPCRNHPDMDLAAYVVAYSTLVHDYDAPRSLSLFVPKDVVIENNLAKFTTIRPPGYFIRGSVPAYILPIRAADDEPYTVESDKWQNGHSFSNGDIEFSPCRVRDPSGKRWLVLRNAEGAVEYYNFDRFEPARK